MADIKAKDISVAQSIAASDLILGSSINETTANVRVDTLGNYLINNLPITNIGNESVATNILQIKDSIRSIQTKHRIKYIKPNNSANTFEFVNVSLTIPQNHIYIVEAESTWNNTRCDGIALSYSNTNFEPIVFNEYVQVRKSGACIVFGSATIYVWTKRSSTSQAGDDYIINYVDLGEISSI